MKTRILIALSVILAAAFMLVVTGVVAASGLQLWIPPFNPDANEIQEDGGSWRPWYRMDWHHMDEYGQTPLTDAMISALVANTSLTEDEINSMLSKGDHLFNIALAGGLNAEEFYDLMESVHDQVLVDSEDGWEGMRFYGQNDEDESFIPPCHGFDYGQEKTYGNHPFSWGHGR